MFLLCMKVKLPLPHLKDPLNHYSNLSLRNFIVVVMAKTSVDLVLNVARAPWMQIGRDILPLELLKGLRNDFRPLQCFLPFSDHWLTGWVVWEYVPPWKGEELCSEKAYFFA